ncbi:hypothetical protein IIE18_12350 [Pseudomonas sp. V1]|uniref:hypothetical protein n=1 Tax=Pseudomonas arcuscaelestis TaxID=2710591 RepID=UPI00193EFFEF|nr:hypothetical protein [Pseudomonas arcuscaelestis]MBM3105929.1 hypothetical protein [Pseudomonas arcuscaelestis]
MRFTPIALALSVSLLAGCGDDKPVGGNRLSSDGFIDGTPQFEMPSSIVYEMTHKPNPDALYGNEYRVKETNDWESEDWTLWIVSNSYSDARSSISGAGGYEESGGRARREGAALFETKKALEQNGFNLKYNYLNYSLMPAMTVRKAMLSNGVGMTFDAGKCGQGFIKCVDRYFYSPASRFKSGNEKSYQEWLEPYTYFTKDGMGQAGLYVAKDVGYGTDKGDKAEFYNWWPTMVFLVNPENEVVRAWLPQVGTNAGWSNILRGVAEEFDKDLDNINIEGLQTNPYIQFPSVVYYGKSSEDVSIDKINQVFRDISQ